MLLFYPGAIAQSQMAPTAKVSMRQNDSKDTLATYHYTLTVPPASVALQTINPTPQYHVTITAPCTKEAFQEFAIPAWTPGYYQILHYERGIHHLRAEDASGHSLSVSRPSERVWRVDTSSLSAAPTDSISVFYDVDANDAGLGFFGSSLDRRNQRGYINGASAFLYPVGQTQSPCTLSLDIPDGWQTAIPLDPILSSTSIHQEPNHSFATGYHARTYDEMIDSPVQIGKFDTIDFQDSGVAFQSIIVGRQTGKTEGVRAALQRITHTAIAVFGTAPFARYQFFYHVGGSGFYGGLEHHNSTVIHLSTGMGSGASEDFLTTSAHEFFHAWNVKRLRPLGLGPFDYTQPVHTTSLWFAEGVTDYYAQLLLVRSGLKTREWFWRDMLKRIQELDRTPASVRVSLREASSRSWEGSSEGYDGLSYYLKGSLVGLYFDLRLRALTRDQAGLDDVMRRLDTDFGARNQAYPEDAIRTAINAIAKQDLSDEYTALVDKTAEINWSAVLAAAGMQLQRDPAAFLGIRLADEQSSRLSGVLIQSVEAGHAAARMGVEAGDHLLNVNDASITPGNFQFIIHALVPNSPVALVVQRGGNIFSLNGKIGTVYEHHQLMPVPLGELSSGEQQAAKKLQNELFNPSARNAAALHTSEREHPVP